MEVVAGGQASRLFTGGGQVSSSRVRAKPQLRESVRCFYGTAVLGWNRRGASSRPRGSSSVSAGVSYGCVSSGVRISAFSDDGHLRYYARKGPFARAEKTAECESERKKEKKKNRDKEGKRRMKLVRGLADNLRAFAAMDFTIGNGEDLAGDVRTKTMAEAAQALLTQLEALTAEEIEMMRKQKAERVVPRKAHAKMENEDGRADEEESSSSSSCSSESSSDSECGEVVIMKDLRVAAAQQHRTELREELQQRQPLLQVVGCQTAAPMDPQIHLLESSIMQVEACIDAAPAITAAPEQAAEKTKIEVCMGGKCKKSGAQQLVEAFERVLGAGGAVSVCKCLGKCRDGPNVRVVSSRAATCTTNEEVMEDPATAPICVGVGLQDVQVIVASYFGDKEPDLLAV
ncbi:hypothetical protein EJ110_NYTH50874 [Nymphaea thermarum]|nr:hypothetical protein EJ110_NYTH50874 [Nymphaea thermarum]